MQLPDRYQICLTKEEFSEGVQTGLLDFVEQVPEEVFEVASANIETYQKSSWLPLSPSYIFSIYEKN